VVHFDSLTLHAAGPTDEAESRHQYRILKALVSQAIKSWLMRPPFGNCAVKVVWSHLNKEGEECQEDSTSCGVFTAMFPNKFLLKIKEATAAAGLQGLNEEEVIKAAQGAAKECTQKAAHKYRQGVA
jgi:hypothetical protein